MKMITVGSFEVVSLPLLGLTDVVAKVDTGAYSGAVHCTGIKVVKRGLKRSKVLKFTPAGNPELKLETKEFVRKQVRSSSGHKAVRYVIKTSIVIQGSSYDIEIGLSDRSDLKKQVLIGRRFLREQKMLVDVSQNIEHDDEEGTK